MQGRTRHYRVRLIAYDALLSRRYYLPARIPSPTPLAPLVPSGSPTRSFPYLRQRPLLRKIYLTPEQRKIADV